MANVKRSSCITKYTALTTIAIAIVPNYINSFLANANNNSITAFQEHKHDNQGMLKGRCFQISKDNRYILTR